MRVVWNKFYYRPLPSSVTIKESEIDKLGLFAVEDIERDYDFGTTHIKVPPILTYIRTPVGGFLNHSKESNVRLIQLNQWDDYKIFNMVSTRKINKGQEILLDYEHGDHPAMIYKDQVND